jgi:hypothetical protein
MITKMQSSVRDILGSGAALTDEALDRLLPGADQSFAPYFAWKRPE